MAHEALSSAEGVTELRAPLPMLITIDRPDHARLRKIVAPHFTAAAAQRWRPLMEAIVDDALDRMVASPGGDAVAELAVPLPIRTIATILGIPDRDFDVFREWSDSIVEGFNGGVSIRRTMRATPSILRAVHRLNAYLRVHFEAHRDRPTDDLISLLVASTGEGTLTDDELFWFVLLLLVAGNETTTNLIGSMLHALAARPALYARLRDEPELIPSVVEEALRWGSPIQGFFRSAITAHGPIPAGARVLLLFGAANRDPRVYPDPDEFVLDRNPTDHVAFGTGIHYCLGAHLARVEGAVVLERMLARVERFEPAGTPVWTANPILRGLARLPLRLSR